MVDVLDWVSAAPASLDVVEEVGPTPASLRLEGKKLECLPHRMLQICMVAVSATCM